MLTKLRRIWEIVLERMTVTVFYLKQIMKYFQAQRLRLADADGNTI